MGRVFNLVDIVEENTRRQMHILQVELGESVLNIIFTSAVRAIIAEIDHEFCNLRC